MPRAVTQVTNDGLHNEPREGGRNPQQRNLILGSAQGLKDSRHVTPLQCKTKLDAEETETNVPDLPN